MAKSPKRNLETPDILSDLPLDQPNQKAYFHFDEFAATLARLIADKSYDSDPLRKRLKKQRGIDLICPHRRNRTKPKLQDGRKLRRYRRRYKIERTFAWLGSFRRLVRPRGTPLSATACTTAGQASSLATPGSPTPRTRRQAWFSSQLPAVPSIPS